MLRLALIGHPVQHSLSPPMHKAAFFSLSINGTYELLDLPVQTALETITRLPGSGLSGWNVTVPHKELVFNWIKQVSGAENLSAEARIAGAVNCVRITSSGTVQGHNTDLGGFLQAYCNATTGGESTFCNEHSAALILGAGGAARACICALAMHGVRSIYVVARDINKSRLLCDELAGNMTTTAMPNKTHSPPLNTTLTATAFDELSQWSPKLVVNCTPIGLTDEEPPCQVLTMMEQIPKEGFFFDTVYNRAGKPTTLCRIASTRAIRNTDGRAMLVEQAVLAFQYWTGRLPSAQLMRSALEEHIASH